MTESEHTKLLAKYINDTSTDNELPQSLFDSVETVVRDYCFYEAIRHGENVFIDKDAEPISWHFNNDYLEPSGRVTVCYKNGREWVNDCYLDELPVAFLLHILKAIKNRRPLNDARPKTVEDEATAYLEASEAEKAERELKKNLAGLKIIPHSMRDLRDGL